MFESVSLQRYSFSRFTISTFSRGVLTSGEMSQMNTRMRNGESSEIRRRYSEPMLAMFTVPVSADLQKIHFCTRAGPETKPLEEENKIKLDPMKIARIKADFGRQKDADEITQHNTAALSQMDKKIKKNIEMLKREVKRVKENDPKSKEENSTETLVNWFQYLGRMKQYMPLTVSSTDELQAMISREFGQFNMSDLNEVPSHIMVLSTAGLMPFLIPCFNVMASGYTPGMALVSVTYSSILLTTLGALQLSPHVKDIFNQKLAKEDIPGLVTPFSFAWLSLLAPSGLGLVLNSAGLVILLLGDIERNPNRLPWHKALRMTTTSTAVITMLLMATGKLFA